MDDFDQGRPATPTHHPTAGVRILRQEIDKIASLAFPGCQLLSVAQLPSGESYNNRLYFLNLRHSPHSAAYDSVGHEQTIVLKVNGRFFGANKIQNEVACLQLIQKYCPDVPAPHPLAWSEDGSRATSATAFHTGSWTLELPVGVERLQHGGWILMSEVKGRPVPTTDLDTNTLIDLGRQLGDVMASLRENIPRQALCGNLRLPQPDVVLGGPGMSHDSDLAIRDILQEGINVDEPITSPNQYYQIRLADKLQELQTSETFAPNRALLSLIKTFMEEVLPNLELSGYDGAPRSEFVFTHHDLSPRNVLVSGSPLRITGLVDFEFAGFFPPLEEFLNDYVSNTDDWSHTLYDAYLARLESRGVATPIEGIGTDIWTRNLCLETLAMNIAPWDLPGGYSEDEIADRLRQAEAKVKEMIQNLK